MRACKYLIKILRLIQVKKINNNIYIQYIYKAECLNKTVCDNKVGAHFEDTSALL